MKLEFRGWTAIDTLYELKGFQLAGSFYDKLYAIAAALVIAIGIVRVLHDAQEENRLRKVLFHIFYVVFMLWLLWPIAVPVSVPAEYALQKEDLESIGYTAAASQAGAPVVRAPRAMAWIHLAIDGVVRVLTRQANGTFEKAPFAEARAETMLRQARIRDPGLRERYAGFVRSCYLPVLVSFKRAKGGEKPLNYWDPFQVPTTLYEPLPAYDLEGRPIDPNGQAVQSAGANCDVVARPLQEAIDRHLDEDTVQIRISGALNAFNSLFDPKPTLKRHVLYNETSGLLATNEIQELESAIPAYDLRDPKQEATSMPESENPWSDFSILELVPVVTAVRTIASEEYRDKWSSRLKWTASKAVRTVSAAQNHIDRYAEGPALYYKVTTYAPYMYGLTMMVLIAFFPFAAATSLLPQGWKAILAWSKLLLWVKLWMLLWAIYAGFNKWRFDVVTGTDPSNGIGNAQEIFPAVALLYVATPLLSGAIVSLLSVAGKGIAAAVGSIAPGGGGGSGVNVTAQAGKAAAALLK